MQELRAPDVMPDEDILILTKTEMLKPGRNLLRSPEVNCQRWKSRSVLNTQSPEERQREKGDYQQTPEQAVRRRETNSITS